jgi:hypothetical protein
MNAGNCRKKQEEDIMRVVTRLIIAATALGVGLGTIPAYAWGNKSDLDGNYGYRYLGVDGAVTKSTIAATGNFTADGSGNILSGTMTYNDGGMVCNAQLGTSLYGVKADGVGRLHLNVMSQTGSCPIGPNFDFSIALTLPDSTGTAQHIEMSAVSVTVNGMASTSVVVSGEADLVHDSQ